jgi:hypothetical protein
MVRIGYGGTEPDRAQCMIRPLYRRTLRLLFKITSIALLFIVLGVCYAV